MKKTVSFITIGHSPREDIMDEMTMHLSPEINIRQVGVLDPYTVDEVKTKFAASDDELKLVSRLSDKQMTAFSKSKVMPMVQETIDRECADGAALIVILCTNKLDELHANVPFIEPYELIHSVVGTISSDCKVGALFPFEEFGEEMHGNWLEEGIDVVYRCAHADSSCSDEIADYFTSEGCNLLVEDCIGYSWDCKTFYAEKLGIPVVHPRSLIADMIHNLLNIKFGG